MKKIILGLVLSLLLTASANAAEFNSNLKFGSKGTEVKKLQEFLIEQDLYSGPITGNFFSLTLKAVKAFQSRERISPVSGFFGVLSRARANVILDEQLVESDAESVNEPVAIAPDTSLGDVVAKLNEQNRLLQGSLDLQRSEADRLRAEREAEAARIKAIADKADAEANARQQAEQAARDLAAEQAALEASRPLTQSEMAERAKQILYINSQSSSSVYFSHKGATEENWGNSRVVFFGKDILVKDGAPYLALTFENDQLLPFYPAGETFINGQPIADSVAQGYIGIPDKPYFFYRPAKTFPVRLCQPPYICNKALTIDGLYFKGLGWKYQIIFSYPGRQESTYEGTFNTLER